MLHPLVSALFVSAGILHAVLGVEVAQCKKGMDALVCGT